MLLIYAMPMNGFRDKPGMTTGKGEQKSAFGRL